MKRLAPKITRQRLLIEGFYNIPVDKNTVTAFFDGITGELGLKAYGKPAVHSPSGQGKAINQGFDAFVPLVDSGISLYVWSNARFFSIVIYSCRRFEVKKAVAFARHFFSARDLAYHSF